MNSAFIADASNIRTLRDLAAGMLHAVRGPDREMIRFRAPSRQYEEQFDNLVDLVTSGVTWRAALVRFGTSGPITGHTDASRRKTESDHRTIRDPLPVQLVTPSGVRSSRDLMPPRFKGDLVT